MANNSIRVLSSTEYVIEVNDKGDTISFDLGDPSLIAKITEAYDRIQALTDEYQKRSEEIAKRPDEPYNDIITKNQYDLTKLAKEFYTEARKAADSFLGEGGCRKIFGDRNWPTMFYDLAEQLEPHFKAMDLNYSKIMAKVAEKYAPNRAARRAMK